MKSTITSFVAVYAIVIGATSCNSSNSISTPTIQNPGTTAGPYIQIERLARPAVKEAVQAYDQHETTARANPYSDPTLPTAITTFMTQTAGRSQATANLLQTILIPDETIFDLSQTKAAYLGVETKGATGGTFGGRALTDDVISIDLGAIFGNTLSNPAVVGSLAVPDDGKEIPCLTTDNVPASSQAKPQATFPYLNAPN